MDKNQIKKTQKSMTYLWFLLKMNKKKCAICPIYINSAYVEHKEVCKCKYNSKQCRAVLGSEYTRENLQKKDSQ